uniref:NlpC/P60 domain-containing protein n=1 Tax=Branchiostoma floridae TaxID=7739 RepID=C3XPY2_BRAFL|eukprot:XP_002613994.1 hypothetical protein BRAFLDRAFT_67425 [Branchiostoma floridae]
MAGRTDTVRPATAGSKPPQPCVFEVNFAGNNKENKGSKKDLQGAFRQYKKRRQTELKTQQLMKERELQARADPTRIEALRHKFLETAKKYYGVPYAKKYHHPDSPEYGSPLFLDCCGLVRRVLRELKEDFGFTIGSWNQAYMFDTLPNVVEREEDMRPGDLVFVSGIYYNPKSKKQRHNMVHVEIWAGEGEKVVGARWQRGKVQMFDSYRFQSKSYHSMQYHFRSIDTWLQGICKSYCPDHPWTRSSFVPTQRSVFAVEEPTQQDQEAGDADDHTQLHGNHGNQKEAAIDDVTVCVAQDPETSSDSPESVTGDAGPESDPMFRASPPGETAASTIATSSDKGETLEEITLSSSEEDATKETSTDSIIASSNDKSSIPVENEAPDSLSQTTMPDVLPYSQNKEVPHSGDVAFCGDVQSKAESTEEKQELPNGDPCIAEKDTDIKECGQNGSSPESLPFRLLGLLQVALNNVIRLVYG